LYAYSKLNSSIDNHIFRFPEDIIIAMIDNRVIIYNASLRQSYLCQENDVRAINAIIRGDVRQADEKYVYLFAKQLVMRGLIHKSCILKELG
jgi:hypothetical protein